MSQAWAGVLKKDLAIEFRTRYGVSALVLFLLTTVAVILFSAPGENFSSSVTSALFWIVLYFGAMTGLARAFVGEEETGTSLLLRLYAPPDAIYLGKLAYNLLLMFALSLTALLLFLFFFPKDFHVQDWPIFLAQWALGGIGIASVSTILSALIARASQKGALLPVLALPVLMPLVIATTDASRIALEVPSAWEGARSDLLILVSFDVAMVLVSWVLFETIWRD